MEQLDPTKKTPLVNHEELDLLPWEIRRGDLVDIAGSRCEIVNFDLRRDEYLGPDGLIRARIDQVPDHVRNDQFKNGDSFIEHVGWKFYVLPGESFTVYGDDVIRVYRFKVGGGNHE